jgi:hypothetical protein
MSQKEREKDRENNGYLDVRQKERKQWVLRHPPVRIKDSPYSQKILEGEV